ncbi:EF-hand domain-containing protein [Paraburkholderia sp. 22B1P]|uniref:EF-hand domain-containing protein n=1 Tax=Paraburkholderia sp. 22B1P TaxID=3080498 RepID=UPI00309007F2|nr:EF-hand domain-containing protein [Paraburkholderia sp. 22B1P]
MKRNITRTFIVLSGILAAAPAFTRSRMHQKLEAHIAAADVDHDGKLTRAEAQAGMPRVAAHFDEVDSARRSYIMLAQTEQYAAQRRQ